VPIPLELLDEDRSIIRAELPQPVLPPEGCGDLHAGDGGHDETRRAPNDVGPGLVRVELD
jgi:hypothetical protein